MVKKHCEKHTSYVYNCDDCRLANNEVIKSTSKRTQKKPTSKKSKKTTQKSSKKEDQVVKKKIPIEFIEDDDKQDDHKEEEPRFKYKKPPSRRKRISILAGVIVAAIIILVISLYAVPKWYGRISLNNQLYASKTDIHGTYWSFLVLDYWSTRFFFNKTGLIAAFIGCVVFSAPPEYKIFLVITQRFGWKKIKLWKIVILWWTLGFVLFYLFGQLIDVFSQFSLVIYMRNHSGLDTSLKNALNAFTVLRNPAQLNLVSVFVYSNLYRPIINYILTLIIIRVSISIVSNIFIDFNYYNVAGKGSFIIALFFGMNFFSIPTKVYDGLKLILVWTTPLAIIGFSLLGIFFIIYPRIRENINRFTQKDKKRTIIAVISLVVLLLIPSFASIPTSVKINNDQAVWESERWDKQIAIEREWTISAAGLNMFNNTQDIRDLEESEVPNIAKSIRQYDKEAALYQMNSYAQTTFEGIGDSDIVYVKGKEYWVSPKTLKYNEFIAGDTIKEHTNQYDHVEGFLAIDPYTGELISNESEFYEIFGVQPNYPIFFGEHEYKYEEKNDELIQQPIKYGAYDDDILLNTNWTNPSEDYNYTYEGTKDGSLKGLSAFWYTLGMGLTSYAFDSSFEKDFLINRNIKSRVSEILLPGLKVEMDIDNEPYFDPYLVFDYVSGVLYYAVSVYTILPLKSYAQNELLRYIGTVLVDAKFGTLDFVLNPQIDSAYINSDPTYPIWKIYLDAYPWKSIDSPEYKDWLKEQLRYPEEVFESQLELQYKYHVDDPNTWKGGSQFYDRPAPPSGDVFYVRFDLGEGDGLEFVGIDLVKRVGANATTLAGMYVLRHGIHFGEVRFYSGIEIGETNMIGPNTAQNSLIAAATQDIVLIDKEDYGNVLLYPLGTSLYYFVPVYSTSTDNKFQVLKIAGFVNAFDALDVVYAENAEEAYNLLNMSITEEYESGNVTLTYEIDDTSLSNDILIDLYVKSKDLNFTSLPKDVIVNISIESDLIDIRYFNGSLPYSNFTWDGGIGRNFTAIDVDLYPSEGYSLTARMSANLGSVYSITVKYKVILIVDGVVYEPDSYEYATFYK